MADSLTTADLTNSPVLINKIIAETERASAFQRLSQEVPLDYNGSVIPTIGQEDASWIGEGELKPVKNAAVADITLTAKKAARTVLWSDEFAGKAPAALVTKIVDEAKGSLARTFDKTVAGFITAPAGFDSFKTGVGSVTVTGYKSFIQAISANNGWASTGIALTTGLLDELRGVVNGFDAPVFVITGDYNSGTINGLPYFVIAGKTDQSVGFVGPFDRSIYGIIPGSVKVIPLEDVAELPDGRVIALKQHNLMGVIVEAQYGFRIYDKTDFSKIVSAPVSGS